MTLLAKWSALSGSEKIGAGLGGAALLIVAVPLLALGGGSSGGSSEAVPSASPARYTAISEPRVGPPLKFTPTQAASPAAPVQPPPPAPEQTTTTAITTALGEGNRGLPRIEAAKLAAGTYTVRWNINANLMDGMVRASTRKDVLDIIRAVKTSGMPVKRLSVTGSFAMTDAYGNTANQQVVSADYSAGTLAKINVDGIDWVSTNNVWAVADRHQVHPEFIAR